MDLTLDIVIRDLKRCARQNEVDAGGGQARAVAAEQRRMIHILRELRVTLEAAKNY